MNEKPLTQLISRNILIISISHLGLSFNFKALWIRVNPKPKPLIPIQQLYESELQLPKSQQNSIFYEFFNTLIRGPELFGEKISLFKPFLKYRYASQIPRLEKEIHGFMDFVPARKLKQELQDGSMVTNNASRNAMLLQQMRLDDLCENSEMEKRFNYSVHDIAPAKSHFYVGLEKSIGDLKRLLFQDEGSLVGVRCMAGGGKTTLALAICNDAHIKGCFQSLVFVTVSQSPNVKGLLKTMWDNIVGRKRRKFQNVKDARMQLQQQLLWQSKSTLVILDDVWSRANLEKLLLKGAGYKTLFTIRDSSTQFDQLPLLGQEDALSLFYFWAFGQTSIPSNADANLVNEVEAECRGLPLALKVIGSCLHGEPRVAWESAKNTLSKGELVSDYHRDGLLRCLETSISVLDDVPRECLLDLGRFPEDKNFCAHALLHTWAYVLKLEWQETFAIVLELASRNLLNLTNNPRSAAAISYGNASELYFSQHDGMRDLPLYLGSQGIAFQKKRLLMPRKEKIFPGKWELLKDRPFDAQIVSLHRGGLISDNRSESMIQNECKLLTQLTSRNIPKFSISHLGMSFNFKALWIRDNAKLKPLILIQQLYESELQLPKSQQNPIFYEFFNTFITGPDYHRDRLLRCLETSTSFLDDHDVPRECFLGLVALPEDKKICADALLYIPVYVPKLECQEAFAILLELASRNLSNLTSNPRSAAAISCENASELYFSQHDGM